MHTEVLNLHRVIVFLVATGLVIPLLRRLKISPILGFLAVGVLVDPDGLARFNSELPWLEHFVISDLDGVHVLA